MATRATQNESTTNEEEIPAANTEAFSVLSPEPLIIIPQAIIPTENAIFLEEWASSVRGVEPEILGTFLFIARQNKWYADTPSGWSEKFSRWTTSG